MYQITLNTNNNLLSLNPQLSPFVFCNDLQGINTIISYALDYYNDQNIIKLDGVDTLEADLPGWYYGTRKTH